VSLRHPCFLRCSSLPKCSHRRPLSRPWAQLLLSRRSPASLTLAPSLSVVTGRRWPHPFRCRPLPSPLQSPLPDRHPSLPDLPRPLALAVRPRLTDSTWVAPMMRHQVFVSRRLRPSLLQQTSDPSPQPSDLAGLWSRVVSVARVACVDGGNPVQLLPCVQPCPPLLRSSRHP
jgi:hypothetical protein